MFGLVGIYFVIWNVDGMVEVVGIDFTVCLFSTLGIYCVTGDVDRVLESVGIDFTILYFLL